MVEPTGSAAGAALAAIGAALVAILGVEPQALIYGTVGGCIGLALAPKTGPLRAIFVFLSVTLLCALFGTWAAAQYFGGHVVTRNLISAVTAAVFHPIFSAVVTAIPAIVSARLARWGVKP